MQRLVTIFAIVALVATGVGCHRIEDDDLVGFFVLERDSMRIELRLNRDHTYTERVADAGGSREATGTWRYWDGPRNLSLNEVWVPFVPLGSKNTSLKRTLFTFHVDRCGDRICLGVSDNDPPLRFIGS
jgi:hypothetical protein